MIVRARSPYIIFINEVGQTSGKLELRIWNSDETKPTLPTYSFTKSIPSATQTLLRFNISPYLKDFISKLDNGIIALKNTPIPPSYAALHLDLINFMNLKRTILVDLYNYTSDPIRALVASDFLTEVDDYYYNWVNALTNKMEQDGALDYFQF